MSSERCKLSDIADVQGGYAFKSADFSDAGVAVIKIANIQPPLVSIYGADRVLPEKLKGLERFELENCDILMAMTGATVGKVGRFRRTERAYLNQRVARISAKKGRQFNDFIYAVVSLPGFDKLIEGVSAGSAQANISAAGIGSVEIHWLSENEQTQIGSVARALDDRIALLRETNATLEAIAQALFKSWFVDFDPVRAKTEGRQPEGMDPATAALFPDTFEDSELGPIPQGWEVKILGEMCAVTIGGLWGCDTQEGGSLIPVISLRGVDLEHLRMSGFSINAPVRWVKPEAMEKRRLSEHEVLVAGSGAGPCGRPLWAGASFEDIYGYPVIFSNFVKRFDCGSSECAIYVDRLFSDMRESKEIWNFINGTSVPNLDDRLLLATKKVVQPSVQVMKKFEEVIRPLYEKLYDQRANTLTQLRDTLLPRLISGQLRLPEAESLLENAL